MIPLQGGPPIYQSRMGELSCARQRQKVQVLVKQAAVGTWRVRLFGSVAEYVAGGGDTATSIRDGLRDAIDALALPVTTSSLTVQQAPAVQILADVAGLSMLVQQQPGDIPPGGQSSVLVVDDNIQQVSYNWGIWEIRLVFRDVPNAGGSSASNKELASILAERVRCWFQVNQTLPVVNGSAYPYQGDELGKPKVELSWRTTSAPISVPELESGVWTRAVALDVEFDVPVGLVYDIPSLDSVGPGVIVTADH